MLKKIFIGVAIVLAFVIIIGSVGYLSNKYLDKQSNKTLIKTECAGKISVNHQVVIENDKVTPAITNGKLCDTMTITNKDSKNREMAFGQHSHHVAYDGITEELLAQDKSLTVTFDKTGEYIFHDHYQDEVLGTFVVVNE